MQGLSIDTYLQITGQTLAQLKEQMKDQALSRIKNSLVLEAIAEAEQVEVSEEDIDAEIKKMAESYGLEEEQVRTFMTETEMDSLKNDLKRQKALELISA